MKIGCFAKNLLKTQIKASNRRGLATKIILKKISKLSCCINVPAKTAPKNVLPTSPIKILEGCQFQNKNPNKAREFEVDRKSRIYTDFNSALGEAKKLEKPLFLYFGARWCIPCKKIKAVVLEDKVVKKMLSEFVVAYLDCTDGTSAASKIKEDRFNSHSMPFFAFFDSNGKHLKDLDIHGAVGIDDLLVQLSKVQ